MIGIESLKLNVTCWKTFNRGTLNGSSIIVYDTDQAMLTILSPPDNIFLWALEYSVHGSWESSKEAVNVILAWQ
jgi:hypothetical protein